MKKIIVSFSLLALVFSAAAGEITVRTQSNTPHEELAARELKYYGKKLTEEELSQVDEFLRNRMIEMKREHAEYLENKKNKKA